jgi:hypothetical protein
MGTSQELAVETDPPGASCTFARGADGAVGAVSQTPGKLSVQRRKEDLQVTCTRDGYETVTETVTSSFTGATVGNVILGGLVGVAIDASSGANNRYPEKVIVVMAPSSLADAAAQNEYLAKAAERLKESTDKEIKTIRDSCSSTQREFCQIDIQRIEGARDRALASIERGRAAAKIASTAPSR